MAHLMGTTGSQKTSENTVPFEEFLEYPGFQYFQ